MSNGSKQYIGSGKPTENDGIKVTLRMDEAKAHMYTTDKGTFLTFVVTKKREADQYGKTHAAFVMQREEKAPESMVNEPVGLPEGEVVEEGGRKLRKISAKQAAAIRRKAANA